MKPESVFAVAALAAAGIAAAQQPRAIDPADPATAAPRVRYQSAYSGFRSQPDDRKTSWREANDEVRRLGGHLGHVTEAAVPKPVPKGSAQGDSGGRK